MEPHEIDAIKAMQFWLECMLLHLCTEHIWCRRVLTVTVRK